jgi:hypothetical protein
MNKKLKNLLLLITSFVLLLASNLLSQTIEVYVSDAGNFTSPPWQILKFDENGENPEVFIKTNLAWPQDIVFIEDQDVVLISNLDSGKITKHNSSTGTYIEDFATGISGPTRMKIGEDSLLYVLQWSGNGRVKRYQLDGTFVDNFTNVLVPQCIGIDWDSNGNLYVSSYNGKYVKKFDTNGNDLGNFINTNLLGPTNIWFDESGDMLVSDYNGTAVKRFDTTGAYVNNFLTGLSNSEGVAFFPNGDILIGNGATSSVKLFDNAGNYIEDFIASGAGNLLTPNAVVIRENNSVSVSGSGNSFINNYILKQNYPNPFNPSTIISFSIPNSGFTQLKVYDMLGNEIKALISENKEAGNHTVEFNAENLTNGIYFYRFISGNFSETKKMILLK